MCKKYRKKLRPNIYVDTKLLRPGESIRGNIIIVSYKNNSFISLTKKQAIKCIEFLRTASFNYSNKNKNNNIFVHKDTKSFKNLEKELISSDVERTKTSNKQNEKSEILQMILAIQSTILKFIKNNKN